jgi:hypothetical protein
MTLDLSNTRLHQIVRARLVCGELICELPSRTWAGQGNGERCALCDDLIDVDQIAYETCCATRPSVHFHLFCFDVWMTECAGLLQNVHLSLTDPHPT